MTFNTYCRNICKAPRPMRYFSSNDLADLKEVKLGVWGQIMFSVWVTIYFPCLFVFYLSSLISVCFPLKHNHKLIWQKCYKFFNKLSLVDFYFEANYFVFTRNKFPVSRKSFATKIYDVFQS